MVATGFDIKHEQNFTATEQIEIMIGEDDVIRVNIDGTCAIRIRRELGCSVDITGNLNALSIGIQSE